MKKLLYIFLILIALVFTYYLYAASNFKSKLSTSNDIGFATSYYIMHPTMYPKFYSGYLFDKYERSELLKLQEEDPSPYKFIIAFYSFDDDQFFDIYSLHKDRIDQLEDDLICIGLSKQRVEKYQPLFKNFKEGSYLVKKYKKLDFETLSKHCEGRVN